MCLYHDLNLNRSFQENNWRILRRYRQRLSNSVHNNYMSNHILSIMFKLYISVVNSRSCKTVFKCLGLTYLLNISFIFKLFLYFRMNLIIIPET